MIFTQLLLRLDQAILAWCISFFPLTSVLFFPCFSKDFPGIISLILAFNSWQPLLSFVDFSVIYISYFHRSN